MNKKEVRDLEMFLKLALGYELPSTFYYWMFEE